MEANIGFIDVKPVRAAGAKIWRWQHRGGSIPPPGTNRSSKEIDVVPQRAVSKTETPLANAGAPFLFRLNPLVAGETKTTNNVLQNLSLVIVDARRPVIEVYPFSPLPRIHWT